MKNLLFLLVSTLTLSFAQAQTIVSVIPSDGTEITQLDNSHVRVQVSATVDTKNLYAAVFSVDPVGRTKVLQGKNKNYWAGVAFPSSDGDYKKFELISILDGIAPGAHTLRVDLYSTSFRDLVDTKEITFYIKYIN